MDSLYLIIAVSLTVAASGCIGETPESQIEPARTSASISVEGDVQEINISNKTSSSPVDGKSTLSPDDSIRLEITKIETIDAPGNYQPDIEEGDIVKVELEMGARPARKIQLPGKSYSNDGNGTTVSSTVEWSEWNNSEFVFKQRASNYDERKVVEILPGLQKGDKVRTTLNIPLEEDSDKTVTAGNYEVIN